MLGLRQILITQFRNFPYGHFEFSDRVVAFCGPNGVGKTNLLDAIHYLCFTKSYFSRSDPGSVRTGCQGFRIEGDWSMHDAPLQTVCILRENGKKEFIVNGETCNRFSAHIGRLPVVFIAPDDIALVSEGPEGRRRFIDTILSQTDPEYLQMLIRHNKILQERNSLLKQIATQPSIGYSLLEVIDDQFSAAGTWIFKAREAFMKEFLPQVLFFYEVVAGELERPELFYVSPLQQKPLDGLLKESRQHDIMLQRTRHGIHRDDIELRLHGEAFRQMGSQGQRKSMLFALKLAEFEVLKIAKGFAPLLLLDDLFEKLDETRMQNLLDWVCRENGGQVFLTDTHEGRIREVLGRSGVEFQMIRL